MDEKSGKPSPSLPHRWFPEFWAVSRGRLRPQARLLGLSLVVGVMAGLGAIVFFASCQVVFHYAMDDVVGYHPRPPGGEPALIPEGHAPFHPWLLLLIPAIGGLLNGIIVYTYAPEAEGHGTDAAIDAYHRKNGQIRLRVPIIKIIASAITLGTGGSGGREGPIALIGAGIGSFLGEMLRLTAADRRVLMAAGMGAGIAAIFRSPLAGALFAAEVLYSSPDFESDVIIPAGLASVTAYCTFGMAFGWTPLFYISPEILEMLKFNNPLQLFSYTLLAVCMAVLAMFYTRTFYGTTYLFHQIPIRPHFKPAIGAFATALIGLALYGAFGQDQRLLAVLSSGYGALQEALDPAASIEANPKTNFSLAAMLIAIAIGKILTTSLTIGSGGSAGVFGPSMVIGGCAGGAVGILLQRISPMLVSHPAGFVMAGMAGFFAAAAKTPFSTLVMVSEITGNYNLLLPTLWVCAICFLLSDTQSIYSAQVEKRSLSPAHRGDYVRDVLRGLYVQQVMIPRVEVPLLHATDPVRTVIDRLTATSYLCLPVVDSEDRLLGAVSVDELQLAMQSPSAGPLLLADDLLREVTTPLKADDPLERALEHFVESGLLVLPVIDADDTRRVLGIVQRANILQVYLQHVQGWTNVRTSKP